MEWEGRGLKVNVVGKNLKELAEMTKKLKTESGKVGLHTNLFKTKLMSQNNKRGKDPFQDLQTEWVE